MAFLAGFSTPIRYGIHVMLCAPSNKTGTPRQPRAAQGCAVRFPSRTRPSWWGGLKFYVNSAAIAAAPAFPSGGGTPRRWCGCKRGRVDVAVAQNAGQVLDVFLLLVKTPRKQMPQVVREHLLRYDLRRFIRVGRN